MIGRNWWNLIQGIEYYSKHYDIKCKAVKGDNDPYAPEFIQNLYFFKIDLKPNTKEFKNLLKDKELL